MIRLAWAERSDAGYRRATNEDAVVADPPVFAVADGMGGHAAGDVASALTVERLSELVGRASPTRREVLEAIRSADDDITARARLDGTYGMGTTLTGLVVTANPDSIVVFNVGDSRSYLYRDHTLARITHDHSVVQELIDDGVITPEQAETHPERNVVTRSLGSELPLEIDWWVREPRRGDRYLICSDGLFKDIDDRVITEVLRDYDPDVVAQALLDAALEAGGADNISLIVLDVVEVLAEVEPLDPNEDTHPGPCESVDDDTNPSARRPIAPDPDTPTPLVTSVPGPTGSVEPDGAPALEGEAADE